MKYRQYQLDSDDRYRDSRLVCWLKSDNRLKPGTRLTLKELPKVKWVIAAVYGPELETPPLHKWSVGGLD